MRKFRDISTGEIITEEELRKEFEKLKKETPEEYDYSFNQYLLNCSETLDEIREWVRNAKVIYSLLKSFRRLEKATTGLDWLFP